MSHAEHFLSRLVRLAGDEVELALSMYRDPEWVRALIALLDLPENLERLAISLDDPEHGPYIVLTRDGHFVSCLSRGMSVGALPTVGRDRIGAAARQIARARDQGDLMRRAEGGDGRLRALLQKLFLTPDSVSREDFLEVAAWEPLLAPSF